MNVITLIRNPVASQVYGLATGTTHAVYKTPSAWLGSKVVIQALTSSVYIMFGTAFTMEADMTAVSTADGAGVMTVNAKTCAMIPPDTAIELLVDSASTYFSIESDGVGAWRGWCSEMLVG
jgi:hypothetical protein